MHYVWKDLEGQMQCLSVQEPYVEIQSMDQVVWFVGGHCLVID